MARLLYKHDPRPRTPFTGLRGWQLAWLAAAVVMVPVVYGIQQFSRGVRSQTIARAPAARVADETATDPGLSELTLAAKAMVKVAHFIATEPDAEEEVSGLWELDDQAVTRAERLRVAIVAGELEGKESALERIAALRSEADPGGDLANELVWLEKLYREGPGELPYEAQESLVDRHGWFGRLALVFGEPPREAARLAVVGGAERLGVAVVVLVFGAMGLILAGIAAAIVVIVRVRTGGIYSHFNEAVGGPLYLETFTVFAGAFLLVLSAPLFMFGFKVESTAGAIAFEELLTWLLVLSLAWPLFRGVPWSRFAWDVGLHRGEGVIKEIGCGVLGYLASIPVVLATVWLISLVGGSGEGAESGPSGYPMFEPPRAGGWGMMFMEVLSLCVWAPLVEEVVFRGALYRYLRPLLRWWGAVLVTAAVFGFIHPYSASGLVQVGVVGVTLGLMREWRGSLIAPITAHLLHNGMIALVTVVLIAALD